MIAICDKRRLKTLQNKMFVQNGNMFSWAPFNQFKKGAQLFVHCVVKAGVSEVCFAESNVCAVFSLIYSTTLQIQTLRVMFDIILTLVSTSLSWWQTIAQKMLFYCSALFRSVGIRFECSVSKQRNRISALFKVTRSNISNLINDPEIPAE